MLSSWLRQSTNARLPNTSDDKKRTGDKEAQQHTCDVNVTHTTSPTSSESDSDNDSDSDTAEDVPDNEILGQKVTGLPKTISPKEHVGPKDLSRLPSETPKQPILQQYPLRHMGNRHRHFNSAWFKRHSWLEYSESADAVFCFVCRHFHVAGENETFVSDGFRAWNRATGQNPKTNALLKHASSDCHLKSVEMFENYKAMTKENKSVTTLLDAAHVTQINQNRHYLKTVAKVLRLTCFQNISQRGHAETEVSHNKGNFLEILRIVAEHDPVIEQRLNGAGNAKYTHSSIQNAIISIMSSIISDQIRDEVLEAKFFSIICDESKDLSKKEQLSICVRYIFEGECHEEFIGFVEATSLTASSLTNYILEKISEFGLPIQNCIAQSYDGAAVMSGHINGVQARIREVSKWAIYIHCYAHRLNLVVVDCCKAVREAGHLFATLRRIHNFISGSYVHSAWLDLQEVMFSTERPIELKSLSDTRWASQVAACNAVYQRFSCLIKLLENISNESHSDRACDAKAILALIDFKFVFCLLVFRQLLVHLSKVSDSLQSRSISMDAAFDLIKVLESNLTEMRSEEQCDSFIEAANEICSKNEIVGLNTASVPAKRKRPMPEKLKNMVVTDKSIPKDNEHVHEFRSNQPTNATNHAIRIYFPIIDTAIAELKMRFSPDNMNVLMGIKALCPVSDNFLDFESLSPLAKHYESNLELLKIELLQLKSIISRKKEISKFSPLTILETLTFVDRYADAFFETMRLLKIAASIPVASAEAERSFSKLRLVKSYLRTTMSTERLSDIIIIAAHKSRAKMIDLDIVVDQFGSLYPNCRIMLH